LALRDRALAVEWEGDGGWVVTPARLVQVGAEVSLPGGEPARVIDTGRRRAYRRVEAATFGDFALAPEAALSWLQANELSGLCLVCERSAGEVALRVFTTSLDGREDVATGGAAAGLPAFLGEDRALIVRQGIGPARRRGVLRVRVEGGSVWLGGACAWLVEGRLVMDRS
jgi:predicted PhzF superfamily epimerase YddE/YHI9